MKVEVLETILSKIDVDHIMSEPTKEAKKRSPTYFLCNLAGQGYLSNTIAETKKDFRTYLANNMPIKRDTYRMESKQTINDVVYEEGTIMTAEIFKIDRGVVFSSDKSRVRWLKKHIALLKK